jgi:hypothetical protein
MCVDSASLAQALAKSLRHPPSDFRRSVVRHGRVHFRSSFPSRNVIHHAERESNDIRTHNGFGL